MSYVIVIIIVIVIATAVVMGIGLQIIYFSFTHCEWLTLWVGVWRVGW